MAKKMVRGITDVNTITNQDFDTNNVNDLLSDGQYNYIHRKKGETEEYHNLTDNIKTLSSDNTDLLTVTNNNKTTNTATLHPKHDSQKEQVLESTRNTVNIHHGENGTDEKTTVDTNPQKVLEHSNLLTDYGISKTTSGNTTKLGLEYRSLKGASFDLNNLLDGKVRSHDFVNAPTNGWLFVSSYTEGDYAIQRAIKLDDDHNTVYVRRKKQGTWKEWREQVGDKSVIDELLSQKQNKLTAGTGITIQGQTIDTNPQKVLEHENLISDSEYITLNHQQGENTTHIQTAALNQVLDGITLAMESVAISTIQYFSDTNFRAYKHSVQASYEELTTISFECYNAAETVLTGELKQFLAPYLKPSVSISNPSISNGAISITNDGTTMKLINSAPSENVTQHATFTFPAIHY